MIEKLKGKLPDSVLAELPAVMEKFQINTPLRLAHFLAQCDHESGGFKVVRENLNYSAEGLLKIFPKYFKSINEANEFARQPDKIANRVYGGRLGNTKPTSGSFYKGRGFCQTTGYNNYAAFDKFVDDDIVANPDLVATKYPLLSAAFFWNSVNLNKIADKGAEDVNVTAVRRVVNGGYNGLDDCKVKFKKYYTILK